MNFFAFVFLTYNLLECSADPVELTYYVASSATGSEDCTDSSPCTLNGGLAKLNRDSTVDATYTILIQTSASPADDIPTIGKSVLISGASNEATDSIAVSDVKKTSPDEAVSPFVITSITLGFSGLTFKVDKGTKIPTQSVFSIGQSGTLSFSDVDFITDLTTGETEGAFVKSIIAAESGTLSLTAVSFQGFKMTAVPLISSACSVTIQGQENVADSESSFTTIQSASSSSLANTETESTADGSALGAVLSDGVTLVIKATTFDGCQSSGNGGALAISASAGSITFEAVTFKNCHADQSGGAFAVSASGSVTVSFTGVTYTSNTVGDDQVGTYFVYLAIAEAADITASNYSPWIAGQTENIPNACVFVNSGSDTSQDFFSLSQDGSQDDETDTEGGDSEGGDTEEGDTEEGGSEEHDPEPEVVDSSDVAVDITVTGAECTDGKCPTLKTALAAVKDKEAPSVTLAYSEKYTSAHLAAEITFGVTISGLPNEEETHANGEEDVYSAFPLVSHDSTGMTVTKDVAKDATVTIQNLRVDATAGSFLVSSALGDVVLRFISFTAPFGSRTIASSLLDAQAGSLYLLSLRAESISLAAGSLINIAASASFRDVCSSYKQITALQNSGGVYSIKVAANSIAFSACTYEYCKSKTANGGAIAITVTSDASSTGSISFAGGEGEDKLKFANCAATKGNGGAIYIALDRDVTLSFEDTIKFDSCRAVNGGAIYISSGASKPSTCKASLKFEDCIATGDGGAVFLSSSSTFTKAGPIFRILDPEVEFSECSAAGNGGAVYYTQTSNAYLSFAESVHVAVSHCTATGESSRGGFAYLDLQDENIPTFETEGYLTIDYQGPESCTAAEGKKVYVATNKANVAKYSERNEHLWAALADFQPTSGFIDLEDNIFVIVVSGSTTVQMCELCIEPVTLVASSKDTSCTDNSCPSLSTAVAKVTGNEGGMIKVEKGTPTVGEAAIAINVLTLFIGAGSTTAGSIITLTEKCPITIAPQSEVRANDDDVDESRDDDSGDDPSPMVAFKSLRFLLSPSSAPTSPLFTISAGSMVMLYDIAVTSSSVTFTTSPVSVDSDLLVSQSSFINFSLKGCSLFSIPSQASIMVSGSLFENITNTESGDGSVLCSSAQTSLTFDSTTFKSCKSAGNGGALALTINAGCWLILDSTVTFDSCSTTGANTFGGAIYLSIDSTFSEEEEDEEEDEEEEEEEELQMYPLALGAVTFKDCSATKTGANIYAAVDSTLYTEISSIKYWVYLNPTAAGQFVVAKNGAEDTYDPYGKKPAAVKLGGTSGTTGDECGLDATKPCAYLETALNSFYQAIETIDIVTGSTIQQTTPLTISRTVTIQTEEQPETETHKTSVIAASLSVSSSRSNSGDGLFTISPDPESEGVSDLFTVSFNDIDFTLTDTSESNSLSLFTVDNAILTLSLVNCLPAEKDTSLSLYAPLIYAAPGYLHLSSSTFDHFQPVGCVLLSVNSLSSDRFVIEKTTKFTNINSRSGSGNSLNSGSVFALDIPEFCSFTLSNAVFEQCGTQNGYGGALFISVAEGASLTLERLSFTSCTAVIPTPAASSRLLNEEATAKHQSAGGAIFIVLEGEPADDGFVLRSIHSTSCSADVGNAIFIGVPSAEYYSNDALWKNIRSVSSDQQDDISVYVMTSSLADSPSSLPIDTDSKRSLSSLAPAVDDPDDSGWAWWKTFLIAAAGTVAAGGGGLGAYFAICKNKLGKVTPTGDQEEGTAMSNTSEEKKADGEEEGQKTTEDVSFPVADESITQ